jgi:hypothetical protein
LVFPHTGEYARGYFSCTLRRQSIYSKLHFHSDQALTLHSSCRRSIRHLDMANATSIVAHHSTDNMHPLDHSMFHHFQAQVERMAAMLRRIVSSISRNLKG